MFPGSLTVPTVGVGCGAVQDTIGSILRTRPERPYSHFGALSVLGVTRLRKHKSLQNNVPLGAAHRQPRDRDPDEATAYA